LSGITGKKTPTYPRPVAPQYCGAGLGRTTSPRGGILGNFTNCLNFTHFK